MVIHGRPEPHPQPAGPRAASKRQQPPPRQRCNCSRARGPSRNDETAWLISRCDIQEGRPPDASRCGGVALRTENRTRSEPEPARLVGEARCALCHAEIARDQHGSRHARTFFFGQDLPAIPYPQGAIADPRNAHVTQEFVKSPDNLKINTTMEVDAYETIVDYAFGSGDKGLTLVGHDPQHRSIEYRLSFYPDHVGWDVTTGQIPTPDANHSLYQGKPLSVDDVRNCMNCHTTVPPTSCPAPDQHAMDPLQSGCGTRRHGPGGNHLRVASSSSAGATHDLDLAIAWCRRWLQVRPSWACVPSVHSPPNKSLRLTPGSAEAIRFQGTTLTWSRCYNESDGKLNCVTCHNPHRDAVTSPREYESRCLACHSRPSGASNRSGVGTGETHGGGAGDVPDDSAPPLHRMPHAQKQKR